MGCGRLTPSKSSLEYTRRYKPESNSTCQSRQKGCDTPSNATEGSALWNWEQEYGKLNTVVTVEVSETTGRFVQVVTKTPCPPISRRRSHGCCSFRYKINA